MMTRSVVLVLVAVCATSLPARAQAQVGWEASSGVTPDLACPNWTEVDSSTLPHVLGPTSLRLQTANDAENQGYTQKGAELVFPPLLTIEAAIWYVSGSSQTPVRSPVSIFLTLPNGTGNVFWIDNNQIWLFGGSQCSTKGSSVNLPTTDGFHEYRIEVNTVTGAIEVFYDGLPSGLTGTTIPMVSPCTSGPQISWGELSILTRGVSEWAYLIHNAGVAGGPVSYCTPGKSASGCEPTLAASGTPSATAATGFTLTASAVEGNKDGLFFFATNGRQASPWGNGTSFQCVVPPVMRAGLQSGSGTNGQCNGVLSQDFNARWTARPAQNPGVGAVVQAQLWYRDPFNTSNQTTSLTDAIEFCVEP